ncbi:hypothetical protein MPTK1_5g15750 [Marchantia polymorpha subsp. ruderalis]|uniref:Uncharacterized protein n=2 Tax=Marchantia polymorpha TaxID=3197 RepID=A0AAF6BIR8_MARPO|nr:hypothetical protein MARPO_0071s0035 [Marchantia polymorpha]BBN11902.1 hypothetical protein Mp_5g15750 [Marchantia polymorpha subsp. ruderalis]|eukprot:PTQ35418.1 hypothetical protein MARPO_0071s0035 [Marchantia polymorpha]
MSLISLRGEIFTPRIKDREGAAASGDESGELCVQLEVQRKDCSRQFNLAVGHAIPRTRAKTAEEEHNELLANTLYAAIAIENTDAITSLLAPEIEWWYHGPPSHQHMKALLTGETPCGAFIFAVTKLGLLANKVFVEGSGRTDWSSWVHVWTICEGQITELREYYNTSIMVVSGGLFSSESSTSRPSMPKSGIRSSWSSGSSLSAHDGVVSNNATALWQNSLSILNNTSIPGIVFCIESFML